MANENSRLSTAGLTALRIRERAVMNYYNDVANNCTYGVGTLVHHGPCTAAELRRPVTAADINTQLQERTSDAERAVRQGVRTRHLTQSQFDSLVSFTYNVGSRGARRVLDAAEARNDAAVVQQLAQHVYVHPRTATGNPLPARRVQGLVNRRREEAIPFQHYANQQGHRP